MASLSKFGWREEGPTRLYLIRHGEVESQRQRRYNGHSDIALSVRGREQLEEVALRLADRPGDAVYASDLIRSRAGAEAIARRWGLDVHIRPGLREKHFGRWEGMTAEEVSQAFPEEWDRWVSNPADCRPAGGESFQDIRIRVMETLEKILAAHRGRTVAVVAHGGVNRVILAQAMHLELDHLFRLEQNYAGVNIIDYYDSVAVVKLLNG